MSPRSTSFRAGVLTDAFSLIHQSLQPWHLPQSLPELPASHQMHHELHLLSLQKKNPPKTPTSTESSPDLSAEPGTSSKTCFFLGEDHPKPSSTLTYSSGDLRPSHKSSCPSARASHIWHLESLNLVHLWDWPVLHPSHPLQEVLTSLNATDIYTRPSFGHQFKKHVISFILHQWAHYYIEIVTLSLAEYLSNHDMYLLCLLKLLQEV